MKKTHSYVTILRCRAYGEWPEWLRVSAGPNEFWLDTATAKVDMSVRFQVKAYEARPRPELTAALEESKKVSPLLFTGLPSTGYPVGRYVLKAPEDELMLTVEHQHARQGDVDLSAFADCAEPVDEDELTKALAPYLFGLQAYLHFAVGEWLVAATPPQTSRIVESGGREFRTLTRLAVHTRPHHEPQAITETVGAYLKVRFALPPERGRALDVALKRFLDAQCEHDTIDRFCDHWEACEFLSKGTSARGDVVSRIATMLADHVGRSKKRVERILQIRQIYEVRKDLVHNALEHPNQIEEMGALLEAVCSELLRSELGLPYTRSAALEERFEAAT